MIINNRYTMLTRQLQPPSST